MCMHCPIIISGEYLDVYVCEVQLVDEFYLERTLYVYALPDHYQLGIYGCICVCDAAS